MRRLGASLLCALAMAFAAWPARCGEGATDARAKARVAVERPIIAGVIAKPQRYLGRRIELYGLVVRAENEGRRFYIQDVSQHPLLVLAPRGMSAAPGDQFIVRGILRRMDGELGIVAERLTPARVTAGGGCC